MLSSFPCGKIVGSSSRFNNKICFAMIIIWINGILTCYPPL